MAGGVLLLAPDDATAAAKVGQLEQFLALAGLTGGIDIQETTVNGTKITTATVGDLGSLLKLAGANVDVPAGTSLVISVAASSATRNSPVETSTCATALPQTAAR